MNTIRPNPEKEAEAFNAAVPVGHWIRYREIKGEGPGKLYRVKAAAFVLSGHTASVFLHGKSGCVCVSHCETVADQADATREAQLGTGPPPRTGDQFSCQATRTEGKGHFLEGSSPKETLKALRTKDGAEILEELSKHGSPHDYFGNEFTSEGNLIYNLMPDRVDRPEALQNDVTINVVAHHLPPETQRSIVETLKRAANEAFCPRVTSPPRTHLIVNVDASMRSEPLAAFWRPGGHGYTTSIAEAGLFPLAEALKIERASDRAIAIPLTDLGHRLIPDDDVLPFTELNRELMIHLLQVSQYRRGKARA